MHNAKLKSIRQISSSLSAGVLAEVEAWARHGDEHKKMLDARTPTEYVYSGTSIAPLHYPALMSRLPPGNLKLLDVGVGLGSSSVMLAMAGHQVCSVEPHQQFCHILSDVAARFELPIEVCQGVAEDLSNLGEQQFDAVFFNASLHHCDDPIQALKAAFKVLKRGGTIFLVNENFLRPWMSKQRYQRLLCADPIGMGHYGGNEHAYFNWEYASMLKKAGFSAVLKLPPTLKDPLDKLEYILTIRIEGQRVYRRASAVLMRLCYYMLEHRLYSTILFELFARASIFPCHFKALRTE